jgi:hypothetical protein
MAGPLNPKKKRANRMRNMAMRNVTVWMALMGALGLVSSASALTSCVNGVEFGPAMLGTQSFNDSSILQEYYGLADGSGAALGLRNCLFFCSRLEDCAFATFNAEDHGCKLLLSSAEFVAGDSQALITFERTPTTGEPCVEVRQTSSATTNVVMTEGELEVDDQVNLEIPPSNRKQSNKAASFGLAAAALIIVAALFATNKFRRRSHAHHEGTYFLMPQPELL